MGELGPSDMDVSMEQLLDFSDFSGWSNAATMSDGEDLKSCFGSEEEAPEPVPEPEAREWTPEELQQLMIVPYGYFVRDIVPYKGAGQAVLPDDPLGHDCAVCEACRQRNAEADARAMRRAETAEETILKRKWISTLRDQTNPVLSMEEKNDARDFAREERAKILLKIEDDIAQHPGGQAWVEKRQKLFRDGGGYQCRFWQQVAIEKRDKLAAETESAQAAKAKVEKEIADLQKILRKRQNENLIMNTVSGFLGMKSGGTSP